MSHRAWLGISLKGCLAQHATSHYRWSLTTSELTLDAGVLGPYEEGFLNEDVSDSTFNLAVSGLRNSSALRGLANGDRNGMLQTQQRERGEPPGRPQRVAATPVRAHKVIFPLDMLRQMTRSCGGNKPLSVTSLATAQPEAILLMRTPPRKPQITMQDHEVDPI